MSLETLKLQVAASVHAELAVEDLPDIVPYRGSIDSTTLGVWTLSLEYGYFIVRIGLLSLELRALTQSWNCREENISVSRWSAPSQPLEAWRTTCNLLDALLRKAVMELP